VLNYLGERVILVNGEVLNYFWWEGWFTMPKVNLASPLDDELSCTHTSLRRAARQLTQLYDVALTPSGLTSAQALLVSQIEQLREEGDGAGPSLQLLARRLAIQISALTHALRPLVRDGLVLVAADARDRRTKRAKLTPEGQARTQQMHGLWLQTNRRIETVLGNGAVDQLRLLADQIGSSGFLEQYEQAREATK
jgi:DNA-binding MarR family transcriptional regulator